MNMAALELIDVYKMFGRDVVLSGLDLNVDAGEIYGFLGRNGAGKSTTIRILMGLSPADNGEVKVFGEAMNRSNAALLRQYIGFVAQEQHFYPWMTPRSLGKFVGGLYRHWDKARYLDLLQRFELPTKRRIGEFSTGMKARLALSTALATRPRLLILDEPTAGMDAIARREFIDLVREQVRTGDTTVFFSTHLLSDIEAVAQKIGVLAHGRLVYENTLEAFSQEFVEWTVDLRQQPEAASLPLPVTLHTPGFTLLHDDLDATRRQLIVQRELSVRAIEPPTPWQARPASLEDAFVALVLGRSAAAPAPFVSAGS